LQTHHPGHGGWSPEPYLPEDRTAEHPDIKPLWRVKGKLPTSADLRRWCGTPWFQGGYPTCNAHVVAALLTYFERRAFGRSVDPSRRFLFKVAKNLGQTDAAGAVYIRQVMGVLKLVGAPPEAYWPYPEPKQTAPGQYAIDDPALHEEPTAFCYALSSDYRSVTYYRLDARSEQGTLDGSPARLLGRLKKHVARGIPVTLGFPLYQEVVSRSVTETPGVLAYPSEDDREVGGHAVVVVGYDDRKAAGEPATPGALLIQNSWGTTWGEKGFGWLSYRYVLEDRARDLWTLTRADWTDTQAFQI
jgi:C1A family cysteine protease